MQNVSANGGTHGPASLRQADPPPAPREERPTTIALNFRAVRNSPEANTPRSAWAALRNAVGSVLCGVRPASPRGDVIPQNAAEPVSSALAQVANPRDAAPDAHAAALDAWARRGTASEHRSVAVLRVTEFLHRPDHVRAIDLHGLGLRELPPLPPAMLVNALGNPLRVLPQQLPHITSLWIDLDQRVFPHDRCAAVLRSHAPFANCAHIEFGPPNPWRFQPIPLHVAVAMWSPDHARCEIAAQWMPRMGEHFSKHFALFLQKLGRAVDTARLAESRASFRASVATWLDALSRDPELRTKTFESGVAAGITCEDRALLSFLQMLRLQEIHALDQGCHDHSVPGFLQVARNLMRQQQLEQIALRNIHALERGGVPLIDEVEVVLAYLVRSSDKLELPFTVREGAYTRQRLSQVSAAEVRLAHQEVLHRETTFDKSLDAWEPWQRRLARWNAERFEAARAQLEEWVGDGTFERRLEALLRAAMPGFEHDADARREAGPVVMAELQHEAFGPLTRAFLREHGLRSAFEALRGLDRATRP